MKKLNSFVIFSLFISLFALINCYDRNSHSTGDSTLIDDKEIDLQYSSSISHGETMSK